MPDKATLDILGVAKVRIERLNHVREPSVANDRANHPPQTISSNNCL